MWAESGDCCCCCRAQGSRRRDCKRELDEHEGMKGKDEVVVGKVRVSETKASSSRTGIDGRCRTAGGFVSAILASYLLLRCRLCLPPINFLSLRSRPWQSSKWVRWGKQWLAIVDPAVAAVGRWKHGTCSGASSKSWPANQSLFLSRSGNVSCPL
ncbi:hypothetical protein BKA80DRAFT_273870 [Phyllosticta citrichinensis]